MYENPSVGDVEIRVDYIDTRLMQIILVYVFKLGTRTNSCQSKTAYRFAQIGIEYLKP